MKCIPRPLGGRPIPTLDAVLAKPDAADAQPKPRYTAKNLCTAMKDMPNIVKHKSQISQSQLASCLCPLPSTTQLRYILHLPSLLLLCRASTTMSYTSDMTAKCCAGACRELHPINWNPPAETERSSRVCSPCLRKSGYQPCVYCKIWRGPQRWVVNGAYIQCHPGVGCPAVASNPPPAPPAPNPALASAIRPSPRGSPAPGVPPTRGGSSARGGRSTTPARARTPKPRVGRPI